MESEKETERQTDRERESQQSNLLVVSWMKESEKRRREERCWSSWGLCEEWLRRPEQSDRIRTWERKRKEETELGWERKKERANLISLSELNRLNSRLCVVRRKLFGFPHGDGRRVPCASPQSEPKARRDFLRGKKSSFSFAFILNLLQGKTRWEWFGVRSVIFSSCFQEQEFHPVHCKGANNFQSYVHINRVTF